MTKYIRIFLGVFTILSLMCLWLICTHSEFYGNNGLKIYLDGPVQAFSVMEMMWWLFLFAPVWAGAGWLLDMALNTSSLVLYRCKFLQRWWLSRILLVVGVNLWYFFCLTMLYSFYIAQLPDNELLQRFITVLCHCLAMTALMVWFSILFRRVTLAFLLLIILECLGKTGVMLGIVPQYLPLVWGMYGYSSWNISDRPFLWPLAITAEIIFVLLTIIIPCIFKRLIIRSVHI